MNKSASKKALIASAAAVALSSLLFAGTTYAWFTDSASSSTSVIQAGNLDVGLQVYSPENQKYIDVTTKTDLLETANINKTELWEPGHTEVVYLKVSNEGSLALKYQLSVTVEEETPGINVNDKEFNLSDYLVFSQIDNVQAGEYTTRELAQKAAGSKLGLNEYAKESTLLPKGNAENESNEEYVALVIYMPETVGNDANYKTGENAAVPTIKLGTSLVAAQTEYENDSYGPDYDEKAFLAAAAKKNADGSYSYDNKTYITLDGELTEAQPTTISGLYTVDGSQYAITAQALSAAAENEGTVKVANDIKADSTITATNEKAVIDLNQNVITAKDNIIAVNATGTISNGSIVQEINTNSTYSPTIRVDASKTLTIDNVTAKLSGDSGFALACLQGSTVYINNSTIDHPVPDGSWRRAAIWATGSAAVEITDSTVIGSIYVGSYTEVISSYEYVTYEASVVIHSGDFTQATFWGSTENVTVYGGKFAADPADELGLTIAEGYEAVTNEDGTYSVIQSVSQD